MLPLDSGHNVQVTRTATVIAEATVATKPTPSPVSKNAGQQSVDRIKPKGSSKAATVPGKVESRPSGQPAPKLKQHVNRSRENSSVGGHVPAYMKSTASVKAKDARDQHVKIAAARSALTENKWNRT